MSVGASDSRKRWRLESRLRKERIDYRMSKKRDSRGILGCLRRIDEADVVYIVIPEGYVGKSVCIDIGTLMQKTSQHMSCTRWMTRQ
jgi:hypothetical protein